MATNQGQGGRGEAEEGAGEKQQQIPVEQRGQRRQQQQQAGESGSHAMTQREQGVQQARSVVSPFSQIRSMMDDMERLFATPFLRRGSLLERFEDLFQGPSTEPALWAPDVDIFRKEDQLVVRADLPGLDPSDVRLEVLDDNLIIEGERLQEHEERPKGGYRFERSYGVFRRVIPLPQGVDPDSAKAEMKSGVLEVAFKMPEGKQRKHIEIHGGSEKETTEEEESKGTVH
jgi:HSP20 family protein